MANKEQALVSNGGTWESGGTSHILPREREKATFDVTKMTHYIDGGEEHTRRRRWIQNSSKNHDLGDMHTISREELTAKSVKHFIDIHMDYFEEGFVPKENDLAYMSGSALASGPLMPHYSLFIMTIAGQASPEQMAVWLPRAFRLKMIGAYAQTELGHGSNVRGLQTTAVYDPSTEEFILNTPTLQSMKWWNSNAGLFATHCAMYAQLIINGEEKGVHVFMVQLRDESHNLLPGIECGDVGPKLGDNAIDTGYIRLKNVRIPRDHLMSKRQHVEKDGTYVKHQKEGGSDSKLHYLTMMGARTGMVQQAADALGIAATIAVRFSAVRHQGFKQEGSFRGEEHPILDYKFQQYRLFSEIANTYAFRVVGAFIRRKMAAMRDNIDINLQDLPEVHATSAGLKGLCTKQAHDGMEDLRKCCGGHGFLLSSGIAPLCVNYAWKVTAEGDWVVMLLQTARFLMKMVRQARQGNTDSLPGLCKVYELLADPKFRPAIDGKPKRNPSNAADFLNLDYLLSLFRYRTLTASASTEAALEHETKVRKSGEEAWNACAVQLVQTAISHCEYFILDKFIENLNGCRDKHCQDALKDLCILYALTKIQKGSQWLGLINAEHSLLLDQAVNMTLDRIRPNAVALVDALDFPDHVLNSSLGGYDGNIYDELFKHARASPLNTHLQTPPQLPKGYEFVEKYLDKDFLKLRNAVSPDLMQLTSRL